MKGRLLLLPVLAWICFAGEARQARADWTILPESRHQLFESYAFFIEHHDTLVYRGSGRWWAAVAANLPLAGDNASPWHPQVLFHFSGNDSMHLDSEGGVFTETLDTRIGFLLDFTLPNAEWRFWAGFFHESGHTVDGDPDQSLAPLNLGLNVVWLRGLRDFGRVARIGLNLLPIVHAIPENVVIGMSEFVEYFPWGSSESNTRPSPYVAISLEHSATFSGPGLGADAQVGLALGPHFTAPHGHSARLVLGYYTGADPRSKYAEFELARAAFGYLGLMFDL